LHFSKKSNDNKHVLLILFFNTDNKNGVGVTPQTLV